MAKTTKNIEEAFKKIDRCKREKRPELNLSGLGLTELPEQVCELDFLQKLTSERNPLEKLPEGIGRLKSLRRLVLTGVEFQELPNNFSELGNLEELGLSGDNITRFPREILDLCKLIVLDLSCCKIDELPKELDGLENLKTLWLSGNPISSINHLPNLLSNLSELGLSSTGIVEFGFLGKLRRIEILAFNGEHLSELPLELFDLTTLKGLHIFDTKIQNIPNEIGRLENLRQLFVWKSQIKTLPHSIGEFKRLEELRVSGGKLEELPASIWNLQNIKYLNLSDNLLKELPSEIGKLSGLEKLNLSGNGLTCLPSEIGNLTSLETLDLTGNKLTTLAPELSKLTLLKDLYLYPNNNLTSPPKHVMGKGLEAVLAYLRDSMEEVKVWTSKLVIVGEGQVGKSCLLDALNGKRFERGKPTTHALNLSQLKFESPTTGCNMCLNVWDFGGQDIYHATHQFYLTNHSLFLLVWSARAGYEAGKIYKWLETISALAPDSPIFIVATNSADRGADLPKGDILSKYPGRVTFFEVDNKTCAGIAELKEAIKTQAASLKYMGIGRPKSWIKSLVEINKVKDYYISRSNLFGVFQRNGVSEQSNESLACYLHDLGEILYYPDEEDLNDTIIVKPEWVSVQIAKILDSEELSKNEGFLDKGLMKQLWNDIDSALHDKLITLMEKFDLSYKTKDDREISLVVEKLKFEEHENYFSTWNDFKANSEIVFKYQLSTIPAGIPTWFIARTHRFSVKIHWRYGVLLEDSEKKHLGLLTVSPESKEVWLRVKGEMPYYFFAQLRDTLELTFGRFEGLERTTSVPCPGHNGNSCKHLFELNQLQKRLSVNPPRLTIECPEELKDIDVMRMIFGLSFAPANEQLAERNWQEIERFIEKKSREQANELVKLFHLEFIKFFHVAQEIMDITCPNIFTLKGLKSDFKDISFINHFHLQLYCQMPGCYHPIGNPYEISIPKDWLLAIAPYYNKMLKTLRYTLPLVIPGAKSILTDLDLNNYKPYIDSAKEYIKLGNEYDNEFRNLRDFPNSLDMDLRQIRRLLDKADPKQEWAGLKRIVSPEGHILWLCPQHYLEYKS